MRIYENGEIIVDKVEIPYDKHVSHTTYFVSNKNGDEYGQFQNEPQAIAKAHFMVSVPAEQRRQYDQ